MFKRTFAGLLIICLVSLSIYGYIKAKEIKDCDSLTPRFNQDINNLSGDVKVSIGAQTWGKVKRVYALVDGKPRGDDFFLYAGPHRRPTTMIRTQFFANGSHKIKIVSLDYDDKVICSKVRDVVFNNELSSVTMGESYKLDKPYCLYAFGLPSANYIVDINDDFNDTIVYSENFTGDIQAVIPAEAFATENLIYDLTIKNSSEPDESKIYMIFKEARFNPNSPARMIVSIGSEDAQTNCREVIKAVKTAGCIRLGGTDYVIPLSFSMSTWDNVKQHLQLRDVKIWVHISHGTSNSISFKDGSVSASKMEELGFKKEPKLNFVYFHTCRGAATDQFAEALGILPIEYYEGLGIRAFIGWTGDVPIRDTITILLREYNTYTKLLWGFLESGNSLHTSKEETEKECRENHNIIHPEEISLKLRLYGISPDPYHDGSERTYFSYPNIYSPTGW